jgi:hypothetical protein
LGEVCELKKERNIFRRNINNKEEGICWREERKEGKMRESGGEMWRK